MSRKEVIGIVLCLLAIVLVVVVGGQNEEEHCAMRMRSIDLRGQMSADEVARCTEVLQSAEAK